MESKVLYAKSSDEAVQQLLKTTNADKDSIKITVKEKPSKGFLGIGSKSGVYELEYTLLENTSSKEDIREDNAVEEIKETLLEENKEVENDVAINDEEEVRIAKEFVIEILKNSDVDAQVDAFIEDKLIKVKISGDEASCLIGRRGETLDAIQFLTGLALNKHNKDSHTRIFIDIENYRSKREESLKRYCYKAAREVAKTKRTKKLDYMNPYERRIIHSALQNDRYVITYSEGTDPYRRVVIEYKR
ncbi:RNA-binding cell elongation regulator Jag/EloR [Peptostreptococcus equinus]|uniref:RNA-binding protein KhpB n=1 Tax=Peptostreptococcus equinus TaxID=3003601 RepID=A0ABY7JS79_9FIRM|nr:RNA-binding cell elongation regulator Jag/EloR [Peptostreptococcus sp. CBA3647]WAW14913.1 protein jag [Peptostreptococcus sp. CBA3647]